ncbi:DISARM system phospholipase D-like protein DrmC [Hydrogenimonas urashimensis]|uniref:DISARM system phospholipase D-like protein DrmC n=1 Tax=Hydrogenimonas urashimensis TaxID=2740515 RepID=UPI0019157549|nr:DISARM system phospholipase D-like protein DrmC [Hydrogenimonas urashimensis]
MNPELRSFLVELASRYGREKSEYLAKLLDGISTMEKLPSIVNRLGGWMNTDDLETLAEMCERSSDLDSSLCAEALRTATMTLENERSREKVSLVWTGPTTPFVSTRSTKSVLIDIVGRARSSLFLVSYVAYDVDSIVQALGKALERGVKIELLMESTEAHGGRVTMDSIGLLREKLPGAIFYWWDEENASVHAKGAVVDGKNAFITSANLTGAAMERNMELGVLIEGGEVPKRLHEHLEALVTTKKIKRVE